MWVVSCRTVALVVAFLALGAFGGPSAPAAAEPRITIEIVTVIATRGERGFGPGMASYKREFRHLPFNRYELVKSVTRQLGTGDEAKILLPGGAYLQITATGTAGDHSRMHALMNHHNRPVLNTDIRLDNEAGVVFVGPKVERGTVIVNIRAIKLPVAVQR